MLRHKVVYPELNESSQLDIYPLEKTKIRKNHIYAWKYLFWS